MSRRESKCTDNPLPPTPTPFHNNTVPRQLISKKRFAQ